MKITGLLILGWFLFLPAISRGDETDLFSLEVNPDVLIVLDLSQSMGQVPAGQSLYAVDCATGPYYATPVAGSSSCANSQDYGYWGDSQCQGPYYRTEDKRDPQRSTDCRRKSIAKRAIFALLDDNGDGKIDKKDEESLRIRVGYMRFLACSREDSPANYSSGCNILRQGFAEIGSNYYKDISSKVEADVELNQGSTPLANALEEARMYLHYNREGDPSRGCRKKFVFFITDGEDTLSCEKSHPYKRRKATVAKAKSLADSGYKVFVIGFGGNMAEELKNTLNWAAYFGGTDNPDLPNSGNPAAMAVSGNPCDDDPKCGPDPNTCTQAENDPGYAPLSGYAYLAFDAGGLNRALKKSMDRVREAKYSFTVASVAAARVQEENYLYEASFVPQNASPFWQGHLKKYGIDPDGTVGSEIWDAGAILQSRDASTRNLLTYQSGAIRLFTRDHISKEHLGVLTESEKDAVVGYIRGEAEYNKENWKLGDTFHSNPVTIGGPSLYFNDPRSPQAFFTYRENNKSRQRIIALGANDGQFHVFSASDGVEKWSFIPPNFLPKLKDLALPKEGASPPAHPYFVDGPVSAADVWVPEWLGRGNQDGTKKSADEWRTLLVFGQGKGVRDERNVPSYLWSSSPHCDSGFNKKYTSAFRYYCGYYAFDVTETSADSPVFRWRLNVDAENAKYIDEPWSRMAIGRVKIAGKEKWVGFIGGGYNTQGAYEDDDEDNKGKRGKGFFVVDLGTGNLLWSFTKKDDPNMDFSIPAPPAIFDRDNDGFIDTAYIGDLGGNMWGFGFCPPLPPSGQNCGTAQWQGKLLFKANPDASRPIFSKASVAQDDDSNLWVFWGTGDRRTPLSTASVDRFFAVKDNGLAATYTLGDLEDVTSGVYRKVKPGWYLRLAGSGEKMLYDPAVFGGMVFFTTYSPASGGDPCSQAGTGRFYALAMMTTRIGNIVYDPGAGMLSMPSTLSSLAGAAKSVSLGVGMPTAPVVSQKPVGAPGSTDVYFTVSGGASPGTSLKSFSGTGTPPDCPACEILKKTPPSSHVIHWKDNRIR